MPGYINSGGVWQEVKNVFVHDGGVWKEAKEGYVNDSGVWRKFFVNSFIYTHTITANTADYNLRAALISAGWDQVRPVDVTLTIASGVYLFATSTSAYAFTTGFPFPSGSILRLINHGLIVGRGGQGGAGSPLRSPGQPGLSGGPALLAQYPITISNTNIIGGGGGGGGGGGWGGWRSDIIGSWSGIGGSGGGAGRGAAPGGAAGHPYASSSGGGSVATYTPPVSGGSSSLAAAANGGPQSYVNVIYFNNQGQIFSQDKLYGGAGGNGGGLGSFGTQGGTGIDLLGGVNRPKEEFIGGSGGAPGNAVVGNSFISWAIVGQRLGPIS
jgi:hypothetical protein